jgi:predicted TIM-barrel fold metal-dependent hydrolase
MPRPLRIELSGDRYHATSLDGRRDAPYPDDQDRRNRLCVLGEVRARLQWRCRAFFEMANLYHFLFASLLTLVLAMHHQQSLADTASTQAVADAHLHYKWNQAEVTSPEEAVQALRENDVALAVVTGTPAERALELHALAPDVVVPIYGVYRGGLDWYGWQGRKELVAEVRAALASGTYRGIGELHLIGGFALHWQRSDVLRALLAIAAEFDVPVLVHTEFSRADPTLSICEANPKNRLVLAHAGAALPPDEVERVLRACQNVWMDLSARDPWRFLRFPINDGEGRLLPEWEALVLRWPDRFLIGSDAVWPVERLDAWDQADTGWERIGDFLGFHRRWASFLPQDVRRKVLLENAQQVFRKP